MQTKGIILQLQEDNVDLTEQLYQATTKVDFLADRITEVNCRLALKVELVIGSVELQIENCRRQAHKYKKHTEEWKLQHLLIDKLIDIKQEINKNLK